MILLVSNSGYLMHIVVSFSWWNWCIYIY